MSSTLQQAIWISFQVSFWATLIMLPLAIAMAIWMNKGQGRLRTALDAIATAPMVLPPVVTGYFLLVLFASNSLLGTFLNLFHLQIPFTKIAAVIAAAVVSFPLMYKPIQVALSQVPASLGHVAQTLGASPFKVLLKIQLPLARNGIVAGACLGFARSVGEFGATMVFAGSVPGDTETIASAIFALSHMSTSQSQLDLKILVGVAVLIALLTTWVSSRLSRGQVANS